ncbi:hypothetical protein PR048_026013 [Dryococelus australis]|uniref:Uncharacterized protein n=1 Tax=Dryococelus australis TaxID=614101 RepID=A0ABQ9GK81_9NEOP|nr:hypothetical protein PR048_026013 [Dryococelus australis]
MQREKTGDPRENPPNSSIVPRCENPGEGPPGIEPGSPRDFFSPRSRHDDTGDSNTRVQRPIALTRKALNRRAMLTSLRFPVQVRSATAPMGQSSNRTLHCLILAVADFPSAGDFSRRSSSISRNSATHPFKYCRPGGPSHYLYSIGLDLESSTHPEYAVRSPAVQNIPFTWPPPLSYNLCPFPLARVEQSSECVSAHECGGLYCWFNFLHLVKLCRGGGGIRPLRNCYLLLRQETGSAHMSRQLINWRQLIKTEIMSQRWMERTPDVGPEKRGCFGGGGEGGGDERVPKLETAEETGERPIRPENRRSSEDKPDVAVLRARAPGTPERIRRKLQDEWEYLEVPTFQSRRWYTTNAPTNPALQRKSTKLMRRKGGCYGRGLGKNRETRKLISLSRVGSPGRVGESEQGENSARGTPRDRNGTLPFLLRQHTHTHIHTGQAGRKPRQENRRRVVWEGRKCGWPPSRKQKQLTHRQAATQETTARHKLEGERIQWLDCSPPTTANRVRFSAG